MTLIPGGKEIEAQNKPKVSQNPVIYIYRKYLGIRLISLVEYNVYIFLKGG